MRTILQGRELVGQCSGTAFFWTSMDLKAQQFSSPRIALRDEPPDLIGVQDLDGRHVLRLASGQLANLRASVRNSGQNPNGLSLDPFDFRRDFKKDQQSINQFNMTSIKRDLFYQIPIATQIVMSKAVWN